MSRGFLEVGLTTGELPGTEIIKNAQEAVSQLPGIIVEITPEEGRP